jgi:hypothetical protein
MFSDYRCFELYGFDILLDENLKPWILEVNASPSLSASSDMDKALKEDLVSETLDITIYEKRRKRQAYQDEPNGGASTDSSSGTAVGDKTADKTITHSGLQLMMPELESILRGFDPVYYDGRDLSDAGITLGLGHGGTLSSTGGQGILGRTKVNCRLGTEIRQPPSYAARMAALKSVASTAAPPVAPGPSAGPGGKVGPSAKGRPPVGNTTANAANAARVDVSQRPRSRSSSASKRRGSTSGAN